MKKLIYILTVIILLGSCQQNDVLTDESGLVKLNVSISDNVMVKSRADVGPEETELLKQNCKIRVFHNDNLVKRFRNWNDIPAEGILLPVGDNYRIKVNAGDSVAASFDKKYYEGVQNFVVNRQDNNTVDVNCNIVNTLVKVVFDDQWENYLAEAKVDVAVEGGSLAYQYGSENKVGYYTFPADKPYFTYTFTGKTVNNKAFSYKGRIDNIAKATLYTLTFNPKEGESDPDYDGGAFFKLVVDDTPLFTREENDALLLAPRFEILNNQKSIDLHEVWIPSATEIVMPTFYIRSSTPLTEAVITSQLFADMGVDASIDLLGTDVVQISSLYRNGFAFGISEDRCVAKLVVKKPVNEWLNSTPTYEFQLHAKDSYNEMDENFEAKVSDLTFQIQMIDLNVKTIQTPLFEIWSRSAVVYGEKFPDKNPQNRVYFQYREKDAGEEWTEIESILSEDGLTYKSAKIQNLKPSTVYEYQLTEEGKESFGAYTFTTEADTQFPNASFEEWSMNGKTKYIFNQGPMFWDSGNEGATTGIAALMGTNMTTEDANIKNNGNYSVKMESNVVAGVLAAGNLFIGDFIGTENLSKGILGFGRQWRSRPVAIEGYVRYVPGTGVDTSGIPSDVENTIEGGVDNGILYVAVGDWAGKSYNNQNWPIIIRTNNPATDLFNKNPGTYTGDGIIAYGEKLFSKNTPETETSNKMEKFRIELDYRSLERIPTAIVVVAAASKYGDYYVGAKGSTMWLDDLKVIYE